MEIDSVLTSFINTDNLSIICSYLFIILKILNFYLQFLFNLFNVICIVIIFVLLVLLVLSDFSFAIKWRNSLSKNMSISSSFRTKMLFKRQDNTMTKIPIGIFRFFVYFLEIMKTTTYPINRCSYFGVGQSYLALEDKIAHEIIDEPEGIISNSLQKQNPRVVYTHYRWSRIGTM